ncbi:MAG: hypothetical protein WCG25_00305 [bacterium]
MVSSTAKFSSLVLICSLRSAWSETSSATISFAHHIASVISFTLVFTSQVSFTNFSASASKSSLLNNALRKISANGSSHFAFAIVALVFFFSLKGL